MFDSVAPAHSCPYSLPAAVPTAIYIFIHFFSSPLRSHLLWPPVPPHITQLKNVTAVEGGAAMISCVADGEPLPDISWKRASDGQTFADGDKVKSTSAFPCHHLLLARHIEKNLDENNIKKTPNYDPSWVYHWYLCEKHTKSLATWKPKNENKAWPVFWLDLKMLSDVLCIHELWDNRGNLVQKHGNTSDADTPPFKQCLFVMDVISEMTCSSVEYQGSVMRCVSSLNKLTTELFFSFSWLLKCPYL